MANHIKFSYMYRDGANYKNHRDLIFDNPDNIPLEIIEQLILSKLISKEYFYNHEWLVPDLHFGTWDNTIDHTWHEFTGLCYTADVPNFELSLKEFLEALGRVKV